MIIKKIKYRYWEYKVNNHIYSITIDEELERYLINIIKDDSLIEKILINIIESRKEMEKEWMRDYNFINEFDISDFKIAINELKQKNQKF